MSLYRTIEGDSADIICWRLFGASAGLAEALLDLNPGLADRGPSLPGGLLVTLPEPPADRAEPLLRLWD